MDEKIDLNENSDFRSSGEPLRGKISNSSGVIWYAGICVDLRRLLANTKPAKNIR
ncbi:MAG: hypothetical protein K0Q95_3390 [Bacteroidota bacterium]|jgi:hypothetical protein|nr:hypothetical protein [Bacteroidota bacterium]